MSVMREVSSQAEARVCSSEAPLQTKISDVNNYFLDVNNDFLCI